MFDKLFFRTDSYAYIHHLLDHGDIGYVKVFGQGHRIFMHDERAVQYIFEQYGFEASEIARAHIALDQIWSYSKRHGSKKQI